MAKQGKINYYVNDRRDLPLRNHQLAATDDDISGTFTFLRSLPDYHNSLDLTSAQIGRSWLNYITENDYLLRSMFSTQFPSRLLFMKVNSKQIRIAQVPFTHF